MIKPVDPETPKLKSLQEVNIKNSSLWRSEGSFHRNGIACPSCSKAGEVRELCDSAGRQTEWAPFPPQRHVHCPHCGFTGLRVVPLALD